MPNPTRAGLAGLIAAGAGLVAVLVRRRRTNAEDVRVWHEATATDAPTPN